MFGIFRRRQPGEPIQVEQSVAGYYEPSLSVQLLPRCESCHAPHPMARKPPLDVEDCPSCGARLPKPGAPFSVPAILTGWHPVTLLARGLLALAKWLTNLAKRFD